MKIHYRRNSFLPLAAALALLVNQAMATTCTLDGSNSGNWAAAAKWSAGVVPTFDGVADLVFRQDVSGQAVDILTGR
jgi:hypothetical protein